MQQLIRKALLPIIVVMFAIISPAVAQAAQNTWLPKFDKGQHVYIDPKLKNNPTYPVDFPGLEQKLIEAGRQNNIEVFVVATESGDETPPAGVKWGVFKLDDMLGQWQVAPGFPTQDYLVIMWVRYKNDPAHGSVAVNAGSRLKGFGMTGAHFDDPNGPVTPAVKTYMRNDPQTAFLTIVANINGEVSAAVQAEKDRIEAEKFRQALPGIIFKVVLGLILLGLAIWLIVRYFRERKKARAAIAKWKEHLDSANQLYIKLEGGYMGFLRQQGDWKTRFKGQTKTKYEAAVSDFALFTVRQKKANTLGDEAQKHADRCYFPFVGGFRKAQALLSTEPVVITGDELPLEMASLFGGVVAKTTYEPAKLLDAMSELFDRTNKALASIVNSFRGAEQNKKDIDELLPEVDKAKTGLEGAGLSFDPYNGRFEAIKQGIDGFLSILSSDPLAAFTGSEKVEGEVRELKADMERAVKIKGDLEKTEAQTFAEVEAAKPALTDAGLVYEPYGKRMAAIKAELTKFHSVLLTDPTTAFRIFTGADKLASDVRAVKTDMGRAVTIKGQITSVGQEITKAEEHARKARATNRGYVYPLADKETAPEGSREALFTLAEANGNPDPIVASSKSHLAEALTAVLAAQLERADQERQASGRDAASAYALVDTVMAAKAVIEKVVTATRENLGRLTGEVPDAVTAVSELTSDFVPGNVSGQPDKLEAAKKLIAACPREFAAVKTAYDEQRFLAARAQVETLASSVQTSRNRLAEVHSRLAELRKIRQDSRDVVKATRAKATALGTKIQTNSFTTSAATDSTFQRFVAALTAHEAEVGKKVTDWPVALATANQLAGSHQSIDAAIDRERQEHESATRKVQALASAISDAEAYVNHNDTRQPARSKLGEAKQALAEVQASMRHAKSDWTNIGRQADQSVAIASRARELAQSDQQAAASARSAISRAESKIGSVNRSYGHNVFADLSSANSYLQSATSALRSDNYEEASRYADSAYSAADRAEDDAQARVAAILAAIEAERRRREEEERRQREEEARRQREAEEAQRRADEASRSSYSSSSSSYDSGSSGSSGGGSYDSGSSGGGSYSSGSGGSDY